METLLDLLEGTAKRFGERNALGLRRDDGTQVPLVLPRGPAARRGSPRGGCGRSGLQPGDRVLTWSPSTPALPAAYFGAMYARLIYVPLDSRMSADAITNIVEASGAERLLLGTGRDAPDPREVGLERLPHHDDRVAVRGAGRRPSRADWEAQVAAWERPAPGRGVPAGVHVAARPATPRA